MKETEKTNAKRNFLSFKNLGSLTAVRYATALTMLFALTQLPPFGGIEGGFCQSPQGFNYQGVARDSADNLLTAQNIALQISILSGSPTGILEYSETHTTTSDDFGVFDLVIGTGTVVLGNFSTINWGNNSHFIKIEMDATGGTNYQLMGTTQFLSVPYALHAENVTNDNVNDADADPTNELQALSISNDTIYLTNGGFVYLTTGSNQTLSFSGDTLYLTNGGYVYLGTSLPCNPPATSGAISGNNPVCENVAGEVYTVTAVPYATVYIWSVPAGATILSGQGGLNITVNWGSASGNVSVTAMNSCDTAAASNLPVAVSINPTTANAGSDSINLTDTATTLNANTPIVGAGLWTIMGGSGGAITTPSNPASAFTGLSGQSYILRWTISNFPCTDSYDEVNVTFFVTCGTPITDARDGQTYNTVQIGAQCWMAENLNIGNYMNSTFGGEFGDGNMTDNGIIEKYCYYNSSGSCSSYGGLYQWYEMMQYTAIESTQGICPVGWHLPSDAEWITMEELLGMCSGTTCSPAPACSGCANPAYWRGTDQGDQLKTAADCIGGINCGISGFEGLPGGYWDAGSGYFSSEGSMGYFASSSNFYRRLNVGYAGVSRGYANKLNGYSVRCVKD